MLALTRVVMKPGDSLTRTVSFPIRRETSSIASSVAAELSSARTISISFILCTGLKKCIPATRAGAFNDPASSVMLSAEVFEAITASAGASRSMSVRALPAPRGPSPLVVGEAPRFQAEPLGRGFDDDRRARERLLQTGRRLE